jgi:hypothetical protein
LGAAPDLPLVVAAAALLGASLLALRAARRTAWRILWLNLALAAAAFCALELYAARTRVPAERIQRFSNPQSLFRPDSALGHRPPASYQTRASLHYGAELVYDVTYTIDSDGLRVSPPEAAAAPADCVLFFGDSYTFGEGVEDDQTFPYLTGVATAGRYRVRNYGFSGYGPHQMLAAIESGLVETTARCEPRFAIYLAHPHHVLRAAGKWWWDAHGPRYELTAEGTAKRRGNFDDDRSALGGLVEQSEAARRLRDAAVADDTDLRLFYAIVQGARSSLEQRYPGISFHVLHWDVGYPPLFYRPEESQGLVIHRLSAVFPEGERFPAAVTFPHDVHPTPQAHARLAGYVAREILGATGE